MVSLIPEKKNIALTSLKMLLPFQFYLLSSGDRFDEHVSIQISVGIHIHSQTNICLSCQVRGGNDDQKKCCARASSVRESVTCTCKTIPNIVISFRIEFYRILFI